MRWKPMSLVAIAIVASAALARGNEPPPAADSLADRFPQDAVVYVELDTQRMVDGAVGLDLVKLLDEQQVQDFLRPAAEQLPIPLSSQALRQMIESVPWRDYVDGRVELAIRGVHLEVAGETIDVNPSQPLTARQFNRLVGAAAGAVDGHAAPDMAGTLDFVARIDAGDRFQAFFDQMRDQAGARVERTTVGGRDATRFVLATGGGPTASFCVVREGERWWLGGSPATLERCLKGGQDSLARSKSFQTFKQQVSGGDPALVAYVNVAAGARMFERLVAPIVKEELDLLGITSIESFGFASSFVEGGVRDSIALTYGAPPTGLVSLLDCTDGGFEFLNVAPVDTGFYFGLRVDAERFLDKLVKVADELFPGSARPLELGVAEASRELGMDLREELLPAFGDELGLYVTSPGAGSFVPGGMLLLEVGDREQFAKLFARGVDLARANGAQVSEIKSLPAGYQGFTVVAPGMPFQPAVAYNGDRCCVARDVLLLKSSLKELESKRAETVADNASFRRVLTGLTGAPDAQGLSLLAFVDLRKLVEAGYQFAPMLAGPIAESELALDLAALPETDVVARHFSGVGIAARSDQKGMSLSFFTPTGLVTGGVLAAPVALAAGGRPVAHAHEPMHEPVPAPVREVDEPARPEPAAAARTRTLAELFANIEKATGATIDFPARLGEQEIAYTPRSGNLETILGELGKLAGFSFEVREIDGEKLVVVSNG